MKTFYYHVCECKTECECDDVHLIDFLTPNGHYDALYIAEEVAEEWCEEYGGQESDNTFTIVLYKENNIDTRIGTFPIVREYRPHFSAREV